MANLLSSPMSDKENSSDQLSSPPASPASITKKAVAKRSRVSKGPNSTVKSKSKDKSKPDTVQATAKPTDRPRSAVKESEAKDGVENGVTATPVVNGTKRKRALHAVKAETDDDELSSDMGKRVLKKAKVKKEVGEQVRATTRKRKALIAATKQEQDQDAEVLAKGAQGPRKQTARKKANPYGLTPGETPFPDWPHPTADECKTVHDLLMSTIAPGRRKRFVPPDDIPVPSEVVSGCGEVPSILDALIRTLLSAATNGKNSSNAFQGLVQRFGLSAVGVGKGSVNWNAVHEAPQEDVFEAIKSGGLAKNKSKNIKKILEVVHRENHERLAALLKAKDAGDFDLLNDDIKAVKELELHTLQQSALTLDYYHVLEKDDAMTTFTALPGIGVKTAACVNLFCMQKPCFAVDTHVFRLCQYLGWVPPDNTRGPKQKKADRNTTFSHCEVMIPDELKYGLHALFVDHGKTCPRCRAVTGERSEGWADANCVIEHLVKRMGTKKGGVDSPRKKTKVKKEEEDSDDEVSASEEGEGNRTQTKSISPNKAASLEKATPRKGSMPAKSARGVTSGSMRRSKAVATRAKTPSRAKAANGTKGAAKVRVTESEGEEAEAEEEDEDDDMPDLTDEAESSAADDEDEDED
jgi:endonuclease III